MASYHIAQIFRFSQSPEPLLEWFADEDLHAWREVRDQI